MSYAQPGRRPGVSGDRSGAGSAAWAALGAGMGAMAVEGTLNASGVPTQAQAVVSTRIAAEAMSTVTHQKGAAVHEISAPSPAGCR